MWNIFKSNCANLEQTMNELDSWSDDVFEKLNIEVKTYFAEKITLNFDFKMIFHQKQGIHNNLLEALSIAEKEMQKVSILFENVVCYIMKENDDIFVITKHLTTKPYLFPSVKYNFVEIEEEVQQNTLHNFSEKIKNYSWSKLIFSSELSNFTTDWINYMPNLEKRSILQAKNILTQMHFKDKEITQIDDKIKEEIKKQINKIKNELCDDTFSIIYPSSINYSQMNQEKKYTICEACYYRTVLTPSGIYPCSYFRGLTDGTEIPTSWENMVKIRNSEINKINPSKQCKHFCARNKINECINILCRIKKYAPEFIDYLGWPIDYGNDIEWM